MDTIDEILALPHVVPFDAALDVVLLYIGSMGKQIVQLMEYLCYVKHLAETRPAIAQTDGYISIRIGDSLHKIQNVVLGRKLNQSAVDGKQGGHGWGKTLDNRKRTL
jgi:hypothetical protein